MKDSEQKKAANQTISSLLGLELIFITGKGGVGKSSVCAALALEAARRGQKVLAVYPEGPNITNPVWSRKLGDQPQQVSTGVDAMRVHPETAMREYVGEVLGSTKLAALLFHQKVAQGLLTGIPGPSDWAVLGKAWSLTKTGARHRARGDQPYDLVIVDAPASGDGSGMLKVPGVIVELAPETQLRRDAQSCLELLRDARRSAIVFVTLPELLSVTETEENLALVRQGLRMSVGPIFVNQMVEPLFSEPDRQVILSLPEPPLSTSNHLEELSPTDLGLGPSYVQASREKLQEEYLRRIEEWQLPTIRLPRFSQELSSEKALARLQLALAEGL